MLEDLLTLLDGTPAQDLFLSVVEKPDAITALLPYPGEPGHINLPSGLPLDSAAKFQVQARAASDGAAEARCKAAWGALHVRHYQAPSGRVFVWVKALDTPFRLQRDRQGRSVWAVNFQVWVIEPT